MEKISYAGKKVAILGLSVEGIDSASFFINAGAEVFCCDRRDDAQLQLAKLPFNRNLVHFVTGEKYLDNLDAYDVILRTPGMSLQLPQLVAAAKKGIEVTSQIKMIFKYCKAPIIGVTGTKGKGTTSRLITSMLTQAGKKVYLGGNVGIPLLSKIEQITAQDWLVLELSSFQLEDLEVSPHIAVVLPITRDHLKNFDPLATNAHPTVESYQMAKSSIVRYQKTSDFAVINADNEVSRRFRDLTKAHIYTYSGNNRAADAYVDHESVYLKEKNMHVVDRKNVQLTGRHNLENIAAAALTARLAGVSLEDISKAIVAFAPLEHHLEFVGKINNVSYYNDSCATIPDPTIAAISSFKDPIILIAGGSDKGALFDELGQHIIRRSVKAVILIGQVAPAIEAAIKKAAVMYEQKLPPLIHLQSGGMEAVVKSAMEISSPGDVVLLSPAAASFDMFKNYRERGNLFKDYVHKYQSPQKS